MTDAVLLLAFGGPERPEEVRPFLRRIMAGRFFPEEQLEAIASHYEAVGGKSPMNEKTLAQAEALEAFFREKKVPTRVTVGFRHASPSLRETLERMVSDGVKTAKAVILAPHQSEASSERYFRAVREAMETLGNPPLDIEWAPPFFDHPLFIEAVADRVRETCASLSEKEVPHFTLLFTAHSIPVRMADRSPYVDQFLTTARLVAEKLNHLRWKVAYQSRSGDPRNRWLSPDILEALRSLAREGERAVMLVPAGFVCDHVEILYDLDIAAKEAAEEAGLRFFRAKTVETHPSFIRMLSEVSAVSRPFSGIGERRS